MPKTHGLHARCPLSMILAIAILCTSTIAGDQAGDLRARFERETNPVNKAKLVEKLGEAEFADIRKAVMEDRISDALAILKAYRDQATAAAVGLDDAGINAEKHSAGYKQLQISLTDSLRRLDRMIGGLTGDAQAPFLEVRKDLNEIDQHLMIELFPLRPAEKDAKPSGRN